MKGTLVAMVLVLAAAAPAVAQPATWQIDPAHTSAQFAVKHLGISTVRGVFGQISGTVRHDPATPANDAVEVTIQAASVDSRVEMRDNDLRSGNFLDVQKFPVITFKSTRVEASGPANLRVTGDLTIRGVTKQVTLDVEGPSKPVTDSNGRLRMGASASAVIDRTDFGITSYPGVVGNTLTLTIDAELVQPTAADSK
jgi:polyisoprenoid-binding protein YceI